MTSASLNEASRSACVLRPDQVGVAALERGADVGDGGLDAGAGVGVDLVAVLGQALLDVVDGGLGLVPRDGQVLRPAILVGVRLGVLDHPLDLVLVQARAALDPDLLLVARAAILRRHLQDAVRVDVERDLDLRHAARRGRDVHQLELAQRLVVLRHLALALEHVDLDGRLPVVGGREDLALAGRDGGVALDQLRHHAALGLDAEGQRGDVEQQHVLDLAAQHAALDGGADGDDLVRVDAAVRLLADDLADLVLHGGHAGHAADQDHVADVGRGHAGVLQGLLGRADGAVDQRGARARSAWRATATGRGASAPTRRPSRTAG